MSNPAVERRLTRIGETFAHGYHAALLTPRAEPLAEALDSVEVGWRGFAYEGAGMALAIVDFLNLGRTRHLASFLAGPGAPHRYLVVVGAGWCLTRLPRRVGPLLRSFPPRLRWLALDGYGFHHGYFGWRRTVVEQWVPRRMKGYGRHAFDQGLGRSLWFLEGADPGRIAGTIGRFPGERRGDLWSGVGLAAAYAGGLDAEGIAVLRERSGDHAPDLAQGATFAARARLAASDPAPHLDAACAGLCGLDGEGAAELTRKMEKDLAPEAEAGIPEYESWRRRVREVFSGTDPPGPG